ncbi:MAG: DegT/DnrJ/EryC1/StrS family aminotransferase [Candidatus Zixiibacteriota bacterium]|nr:MAG: DegT/DnrJ/EryC1/StrS family aminotransferase [candidate division Zixibacteria bacterium]
MDIKFLDLQAQYQSIKSEINYAIDRVLKSSTFALGPAVQEFEEAYAEFCGTRYCVGVDSGTSALVLTLRSLDIDLGDEVVTSANTFIATIEAIIHAGARPVLVDVDPVSRNMNPALLEKAITCRTRAVIPVHLYGRAADMAPILRIAEEKDIAVIEDASQAHGARYRDRRVGSMGLAATFSFYPSKNLGAIGEAGAITTNDISLARKLRMLRDHGSERKYYHDLVGYNARMDGIQGAVLKVKLKYLAKWNERRNYVARRYHEGLSQAGITLPEMNDDYYQVFHQYVIETDRRDELQTYLRERGIPTMIHYPAPNHRQLSMRFLGYSEADFPVTEKLAGSVLSLPIYPELTDDQIDFISQRVTDFSYQCEQIA